MRTLVRYWLIRQMIRLVDLSNPREFLDLMRRIDSLPSAKYRGYLVAHLHHRVNC